MTGKALTSVRLCEETKVAVLVLGKGGVECLHELPDAGSSGQSRCHVVSTVAEADADGLVDVEHVGYGLSVSRGRHKPLLGHETHHKC